MPNNNCSACKHGPPATHEWGEYHTELILFLVQSSFSTEVLSGVQGSHVLQFGDMVIDEEPAADYLGKLNTGMLRAMALILWYMGRKMIPSY